MYHPQMNNARFHTALFLLVVFLLGGTVAPFVHALHHYTEEESEHVADVKHHTHPDTTSVLDNSQHILYTDLECILCNTTYVYNQSPSVRSYYAISQWVMIKYVSPLIPGFSLDFPFLRGPPRIPLI